MGLTGKSAISRLMAYFRIMPLLNKAFGTKLILHLSVGAALAAISRQCDHVAKAAPTIRANYAANLTASCATRAPNASAVL